MTVQLGGGSTEDQHTADALLRDSGRNVFVYLYETFAASLFDYCAGLLPDPVAACDAVQDSLVAVDGQISELPDPDQLRLWLYAAARRACQNRLAARGPRPASPAEAAGPDGFGLGAPDGFGLGAPGPAGPDRETLAIVTAALARLDASDREVLNLAYRHGIEGGDLAGVLGLPARRARALLAGACARFAQSASVVEVLRAGPAGCHVAPGIVGSPDPAAPAALPGRPALQPSRRVVPGLRPRSRRPLLRSRPDRPGTARGPGGQAPAAYRQDRGGSRHLPPQGRRRAGSSRRPVRAGPARRARAPGSAGQARRARCACCARGAGRSRGGR